MQLTHKLAVRQTQALAMTPQLSQSIKMLAMSNVQLAEFVRDEVEKNPLLRSDDVLSETRIEASPATAMPDATTLVCETLPTDQKALQQDLGTSLDNAFPDATGAGEHAHGLRERHRTHQSAMRSGNDAETAFGERHAQKPTLQSTLSHQLTIAAPDPVCRTIAASIIARLDATGYLRDHLPDIARELSAPLPDVQRALALVQTFEPAGIAARDLAECIELQLREKDRFDPAMQALVENLDLLAQRDFERLQKICGLDLSEIAEAVEDIRSTDPKPGLRFDTAEAEQAAPDVLVGEAPDGAWQITLNEENLPRVLMDNSYRALCRGTAGGGEETRSYIARCEQDANWLTRSLDQRAQTILKVATEIVKQQDAFFVHGVSGLKPLTLRQIADAIEMHESTVSRVTTNKTMLTPRGMFEMKYFFTTALPSSTNGDEHSAEAVRERIRQLVKGETAATVLSDDAIVGSLRRQGIEIARRTVAKYRDALNIGTSVQRRRALKMQAALQ